MKKQEALRAVRKLGLQERIGKELFFKLVVAERIILISRRSAC